MAEADIDCDGYITYEEFKSVFFIYLALPVYCFW